MNYENYSIFIQLELENYNYGYLFIDHKEYELYYYNDFDDYEDEIEFASKNWIKMKKINKKEEKNVFFADIYNEVILYVLQKTFKNRRTSINAFYSKTNFFNI